MLNFDAIDCIGIDKVNEWQIPSIQSAKDTLRLGSNLPTDLRAKTQQSLDRGYWPIFQQADVLDKNNFPKNLENLDLAYCRLLLGNIYNPNDIGNSQKKVQLAIENIVECTKQKGLVCIIERNVESFIPNLLNYLHGRI